MKRLMLAVLVFVAITLTLAETNKKEIIALTPQQIPWFMPSYYTDGRERAQLLGDSSQGGAWIDRVKTPAGKRVLAHTHPRDEPVTVIEGTWYLGEATRFDSTKPEKISRSPFHPHSGERASFCCGHQRYGYRSAQRQWEISGRLC